MRNVMTAAILGLSLVVSSWILVGTKQAPPQPAPKTPPKQFQLFGHQGIVYRINKITGRTDVIYPGTDGAVMIPVWQMNPAVNEAGQLLEQERTRWATISKALAGYLATGKAEVDIGALVSSIQENTAAQGAPADPATPPNS